VNNFNIWVEEYIGGYIAANNVSRVAKAALVELLALIGAGLLVSFQLNDNGIITDIPTKKFSSWLEG